MTGLGRELAQVRDALSTPAAVRRLAVRLDPMPWWLEDVALPEDLPAARDVLEQALHTARTVGAAHSVAPLERRLAAVLGWGFGRWPEAEALLLSAVEGLHWAGDEAGTAAAATQLAWLRGMTGDLTGQLDVAREIAAGARAAGDARRASRAAAAAGWAAAWAGRPLEVELPTDADQEDGRAVASVRALSLALSGQPAAAYALLPPTSAAGDDAPGAIEARVVAAFVAGRPPDVLSIAARADLAAIGPADRRGLHALALSAIAAVDADDDVLAQRLIAELRRRPLGASDGGPLARWAQLTLTGRTGGAVEVARPLGLLAATGPPWTMVEQLVAAAASAAAREAADEVSALEVLASAEAAPTLAGRGPTDVVARLVRADAALMGLADAPSDDDLAEAARALGDAGVAGLAAAARAARGRLAAAQGHRDEAIAHLAAAAEDHLRSGRRRAASSVIGDLTGLGQAGRRAAAALGAAPLTAREREIACLAADGHTAQAIADRLVISRRTVETHLAHVYAKLAVSGRREMERRAEELGLRGS